MAMNQQAGSLHIIARELASARRTLQVEDCRPGMLLRETLYTAQGTVIIQEKTMLTPGILQRLQQLGVRKLKVQLPEAEAKQATERYERRYQNCLTYMDNVFSMATHGDPLSASCVQQAADSVIESAAAGSEAFFQREPSNPLEVSVRLRVHSLNTAMLSTFLLQWMDRDPSLLPVLVQGALLHDIGKTKLKPMLLESTGVLSSKEELLWKSHPREGWEMTQRCKELHPLVGTLIAMHHERPDGSGYPMGLRSGNIHPLARILAVADRFDKLTSGTPRERSVSPFKSFQILEREAANGFHAEEIHCLLTHVPAHYVGERFFLSNGDIGEVLHINEHAKSRPLVRTAHGFVDLSLESGIDIGSMV